MSLSLSLSLSLSPSLSLSTTLALALALALALTNSSYQVHWDVKAEALVGGDERCTDGSDAYSRARFIMRVLPFWVRLPHPYPNPLGCVSCSAAQG